MIIGITINLTSNSIWSNGINQNAIYLAKTLAKAGHSIILIYSENTSKNLKSVETLKNIIRSNSDITTMPIAESFNLMVKSPSPCATCSSLDVILLIGLRMAPETKDGIMTP